MVATLAARRLGLPCVVHVAGGELVGLPDIGYGSQLRPWERWQVKVALRLARLISLGSRSSRKDLAAYSGDLVAKSRVLPLGVDLDRFRPPQDGGQSETGAGPGEPSRLLHVAEMNAVKDQATLLRALALVGQIGGREGDSIRWRLDWIGGGPALASLRRLARQLGIDRDIRWWGHVPHGIVARAMRGAQALIHSSRHEGQGMVLAEAAASGLPIATTRVGIAPELPAEGLFIARPGDVEGLAAQFRALGELLGRPAALRDASLAMRRAACRDFELGRCSRAWLCQHEALLAGGGVDRIERASA